MVRGFFHARRFRESARLLVEAQDLFEALEGAHTGHWGMIMS